MTFLGIRRRMTYMDRKKYFQPCSNDHMTELHIDDGGF